MRATRQLFSKSLPRAQGFTLIEVLAALAILGTGLFILLDSHFTTLNLFVATRETVITRHLVERAIGEAEISVMSGVLTGGDEFGMRYPDFSYTFEAIEPQPEALPKFYEVRVTVEGPEDSEEITFLLFDPRQQ